LSNYYLSCRNTSIADIANTGSRLNGFLDFEFLYNSPIDQDVMPQAHEVLILLIPEYVSPAMSLQPVRSQQLVTHKIPLTSPAAPPPGAHLSSAILHRDGNIIYVSGAMGIKAGKMLSGGIAGRFRQALSNVSSLLAEAKASLIDGMLRVRLTGRTSAADSIS
jgi:hypothetical protein